LAILTANISKIAAICENILGWILVASGGMFDEKPEFKNLERLTL
jgi:hypothetical protein